MSRWLRRLPLSPDTLSGRVFLLYDSQSPALDQEELGLQKQGSQTHINKPSNPVLFQHSWGLWLQGKGSPGLWGQAAAATLKEHSFPEGTELSGFTRRPCRNYTLDRSHTALQLWRNRTARVHFLPPWSGVLLSCLSGDVPEVGHLLLYLPDLKSHRSHLQDDPAWDRSPRALERLTGAYCLPPPR